MSSPHRDCAVQTSSPPTGLTLITDDLDGMDVHSCPEARSAEITSGGTAPPCDCGRYDLNSQCERCDQQQLSGKTSAARRHLAKYEPQQLQGMSDEIELGWDCGICLETAEDPCVTRCGHLYCQSHLNHWLSTHPSCPVCKTLCTPAQDVVPIFSRGRSSPVPSSIPSSPTSPISPTLSEDVYHNFNLTSPTPQSCPGTPTSAALRREWPDMTGSECNLMADYDIMSEEQPSILPVPPVAPGLSHPPIQPHPHPLMTSYIIAHYLGIALRIVGVGILLGVLLR